MIHPVTVKDSTGKVKQVITSESLEARSTALCMDGGGHFKSHKMREDVCDRPGCGKPYWTKQRLKRYCSKDCSLIVGRETALKTKAKNRAKKIKQKKEEHGQSRVVETKP